MPRRTAPRSTSAAIRAARQSRGLSVPELAATAGVTNSTIYRIESGEHPRPQMRTLRRLAAALGLSPADLTDAA